MIIKTFFANLDQYQKLSIIKIFFEMYYNTDQDADLFGAEYYYLSEQILKGRLPYELTFLSDDFIDILIANHPFLSPYYKPFLEIQDEGYEE